MFLCYNLKKYRLTINKLSANYDDSNKYNTSNEN